MGMISKENLKESLLYKTVIGEVLELTNYGIYVKIKNLPITKGFISDSELNIINVVAKKKKYTINSLHVFRIISVDIDKKNIILSKKYFFFIRKLSIIKVVNCLKFFYVSKKIESLYSLLSSIPNSNVLIFNLDLS